MFRKSFMLAWESSGLLFFFFLELVILYPSLIFYGQEDFLWLILLVVIG